MPLSEPIDHREPDNRYFPRWVASMPVTVRLQDVINEVEILSEEWIAYIHRRTGDIRAFSKEYEDWSDENAADAPEWQQEMYADVCVVRDAPDDYVALPGPLDFHEWTVMEEFCHGIEAPQLRNRMLAAIHGKGAFRRFGEMILDHGLRDRWFSHRNQALQEMVVAFLDEQGIPYKDDAAPENAAS